MTLIVDVSRHQGQIDWLRVAGAEVQTAVIRCTMAATGVDDAYARNWREAGWAGIARRGVYHYVVTGIPAASQVENILRTTGGDFGDEPLTLDCEPTKDERERMAAGWLFPRRAYTDMLAAIVERLQASVLVRIYTSAYFWSLITTQPAWALDLPLWVADYRARPAPACPPGWEWARWQYTHQGRVAGIAGDVDLNRDAVPAEPAAGLTARSKVGPQLDGEGHAQATEWLLRGRPAMAVGINIGPPGELAGRELIWAARNYEDTFQPQNPAAGGYSLDGATAARQYTERFYRGWLSLNPWARYVAGPNEPVVGESIAAMRFLDDFHAELVRILHETYGRVAVVGNFAVGTPHYWLWQYYRKTLAEIVRYGAFHARHSYGEAGQHQADYALRHRRDAEIFAALGFPRVPTLLTEVGWENLPEVGQRAFNVEPRRSDAEYAAHLAWLNAELMQDRDVLGASVFVYSRGWGDHRLNDSQVGRLCADQFEQLPEFAVVVPEGGPMPVQYVLTVADSLSTGQIRERLGAVNVFDLRLVVPVDNVPEPPPWWETKAPPYKLEATGAVIPFYNADGSRRTTAPTSRAITGNWDVWERRANLLRVTDFRDPARPDWWVQAQDVDPLD